MTTTCVFCDIIEGREPATVIAQWSDAIAFTPLQPVTSGHMLVVPLTHVPDFTADPQVTARVMARAAEVASAMEPAAHWNLITSKGQHATQTVRHLHVHLVPRRLDDGLPLPWTPQQRGNENP